MEIYCTVCYHIDAFKEVAGLKINVRICRFCGRKSIKPCWFWSMSENNISLYRTNKSDLDNLLYLYPGDPILKFKS